MQTCMSNADFLHLLTEAWGREGNRQYCRYWWLNNNFFLLFGITLLLNNHHLYLLLTAEKQILPQPANLKNIICCWMLRGYVEAVRMRQGQSTNIYRSRQGDRLHMELRQIRTGLEFRMNLAAFSSLPLESTILRGGQGEQGNILCAVLSSEQHHFFALLARSVISVLDSQLPFWARLIAVYSTLCELELQLP